MLLSFKMKNFKTFGSETVFMMTAAPKQKGLDYSLLREKMNKKTVKGLCSSVIYGPNAAGKSNIIGAMDVFRTIVLNGNIKNSSEKAYPNPAAAILELIPNNKLTESQPLELSIDFLEKGFRIQYSIAIDLGSFLDEGYDRKVISEELLVDETSIFRRDDTLKISDLSKIRDYLLDSKTQNLESALTIAQSSIQKEDLFLANGFKLIFSQSFAKLVLDWFENKFIVIYHAEKMQLSKKVADMQKKTLYIDKNTDKAAKIFGVTSNNIGYIFDEDESETKLCSVISNFADRKKTYLSAEVFESYGTIRFINLFPLIIRAMKTGGNLIIDEFDASIHPMALMSIVNIFHNDDVNIHHAQLIFNTHNPIFLNSNLFRRDEIKFVERDDNNDLSTLYSLSDFGTSGKKGVRKHEDYMKNYFINQYGAIKDIDFTPIFTSLMMKSEE